ncbi:MAG: hypothetical protein R3222_02660, partial [Balneolaceae bacterium]|nr:hypothetical protein [Balneolaceae bacterium]
MDNRDRRARPDPSDYRLQVLDESWNQRLLQMAKASPVKTERMDIHFDRSPDLFAIPKLTSYKYRCLGLLKGDEAVGFAIACYQRRYIEGRLTDVLYLGNMHVSRRGMGKLFLKKLYRRFMHIIPDSSDVKYLYAYIMGGNIPAMKLLDSGHLQPCVIGKIIMTTIFTIIPMKLSSDYQVRRADQGDIESIIELLQNEYSNRFLAPPMDQQIFIENLRKRPNFTLENYFVALKKGSVTGVCSAWDMTSFKKNRVLRYKKQLAALKVMYNGSALLFGSPLLPSPGETMRDVTIAEYAVRNR